MTHHTHSFPVSRPVSGPVSLPFSRCALALAVSAALLGAPAQAQDGPSTPAEPSTAPSTAPSTGGGESFSQGFSLLSEGARLILQGMQSEMAPMIEALSETIKDVNAYELPEVQPNGDILIRRKEPLTPEEQAETGEPVEL